MHLQENTVFDLILKVTQNVAQYSLHHVTYGAAKIEDCCYIKWFRRKCIYKKMHYLTLDLGVKVTLSVAQYSLHHVTFAATKFEMAMSAGLGGDTFISNVTDRHRHMDRRRTLVQNPVNSTMHNSILSLIST